MGGRRRPRRSAAPRSCSNINRFSLHAMYRNRLIRAYLGASNPKRAARPFTGFDEDDNSACTSCGRRAKASGQDWRPFHVVNIALNLVQRKRLAWQERKAEPFTVTPLHCGSRRRWAIAPTRRSTAQGTWRHLARHRDRDLRRRGEPQHGLSLLAVGALLMTLFNVRLGWWLGNPGPEGEQTYSATGPRLRIVPLVAETFGLTTDDRHVRLPVRRRALRESRPLRDGAPPLPLIVVSDAGCDPDFEFEDLGNAVRKISIDLGVPHHVPRLRRAQAPPPTDKPGSRTAPIMRSAPSTTGAERYDGGGENGSSSTSSRATTAPRARASSQLRDRQSDVPARSHGRPVVQRVAVRKLSRARLRDHEQILEADKEVRPAGGQLGRTGRPCDRRRDRDRRHKIIGRIALQVGDNGTSLDPIVVERLVKKVESYVEFRAAPAPSHGENDDFS